MKNIIIDCDPGHDDALAIMTAFASEKLNILGVTTIGGNNSLEKVTRNAKNILHFINAKIPLASGQAGPLVKKLQTAPEAHGDSGMDGPTFKENNYPIESTNAVMFMYQKIISSPKSVTIVGIGPLTNIALLIKTFPEIKSKIELISIMGGGITHGNYSPLAEFNIYVDPEAAEIVFQSGIPIVMSGLDVTEQAEITLSEINSLKNKGKASHLAYELLSFYNESGKKYGFENSPIHDLCAISYLLNPKIFDGVNGDVHVITDESPARGLTYIDQRKLPTHVNHVFILNTVNREAFVALFISSLEKLDTYLD